MKKKRTKNWESYESVKDRLGERFQKNVFLLSSTMWTAIDKLISEIKSLNAPENESLGFFGSPSQEKLHKMHESQKKIPTRS